MQLPVLLQNALTPADKKRQLHRIASQPDPHPSVLRNREVRRSPAVVTPTIRPTTPDVFYEASTECCRIVGFAIDATDDLWTVDSDIAICAASQKKKWVAS